MTRGHASSGDEPPTEAETLEALLERLRGADAPEALIGDAAMSLLKHLIDDEQTHLAAWHACRYEAFWDDGRKLDILERMAEAGMEWFAITLCHRWKLSEKCHKTKHRLYRKLFPKLPPRNDLKEDT